MTNEEVWKQLREQRAHLAAVPAAIEHGQRGLGAMSESHLSTLVREVQRLQRALRQANQDMREEQREAQHAAGAAFAEGRHEGLQEGRGW